MNPIRVLLVEDQPLFRGAIAALLARKPGITVVGEAENGLIGVEKALELQPDLILMDVEMPVMDGVEAVGIIRERVLDVKVIMLTVSEADEHVVEAMKRGAHGYLLKNLRPEQLFDMIDAVMRGEMPVAPAVTGSLLRGFQDGAAHPAAASPPDARPDAGLTRRELTILRLVATGLSNKEIGRELSITEGTVKNHVHNALEKLGMSNRIQAAAYIVRQGLGRPEP